MRIVIDDDVNKTIIEYVGLEPKIVSSICDILKNLSEESYAYSSEIRPDFYKEIHDKLFF